MNSAFLNELFLYEVILVAGTEMRMLKGQLHGAIKESSNVKITDLTDRILKIAHLLRDKLSQLNVITKVFDMESKAIIQEYQFSETSPIKDKKSI